MSVLPLSSLALQTQKDATIIAIEDGQEVTYAEFVNDVRRVAAVYDGQESVALVCDSSYIFIVGLWGLLHAGVHVLLPQGKQPAVLDAIQESYDVLIDDSAIKQACTQKKEAILKPLDAQKESIVFCTSGSTGEPKFVSKSLSVFDKELVIMDRIFDIKGINTIFSTVPHHHVYGFTFKIAWALAAGHVVTSDTYALWESLLPNLTNQSILISSPAHLSRLDGLAPLDQGEQLQLVLSAGAPLSAPSGQEVYDILGCYPLEIFGSTETGAIATRRQLTDGEAWAVLSEIQIKRLEDGRMSLCSPFVPEGWIETSDLIELVEGGFIHKGRGDRIVKIEGKRVSLTAVEVLLKKHDMVLDVVIVCLKDPNRLAAAVILNEEGKSVLAEGGAFRLTRVFKSYALREGDAESIPRTWRFIDAFPHHAMGKRREVDIINLFEDAA